MKTIENIKNFCNVIRTFGLYNGRWDYQYGYANPPKKSGFLEMLRRAAQYNPFGNNTTEFDDFIRAYRAGNYEYKSAADDRRALGQDWERIGRDMRNAIDQYKREHNL